MKLTIRNTLFFIAIFFTLQTTAQNFSGTITNTNSEAIENAQIVLQYPNAVYENDTVYSDALGYYNVGTVVGIEDLPNANSNISYNYDGNTLYVRIYSTDQSKLSNRNKTGKLFSLQGKIIAECLLIKTSENTFIGQFNVHNLQNTIYIFTDGFYSVKILIIKDNRLRQAQAPLVLRSLSSYSEAELVEAGLSQSSRSLSLSKADSMKTKANFVTHGKFGFDKLSLRKSCSVNKYDEAYHLIINPPNYLPIDSTLQDIINSQTYTYDFECENPPNFFANITINLTGYEDVFLEDALIEITSNELNLSQLTDANGQAIFTNINVGNNPENLLLAGEINIAINAGNVQWYDDMTTDNQTITEGNFSFNYELEASLNDYIQNLKTENESGEILGDVTWKLQNTDGSEVYANGVTNSSTGESEINYSQRFPGEMSDLELIASKTGFVNDTTATSLLPGQVDELVVDMVQNPGEAYFWRIGTSETGDLGTYYDVVIRNTQFNYNDTIFNVGDDIAWKDTVPVNQDGITSYTVEYIPHTIEGKIPLYPTTINFNLINGETSQGYDQILALEQEQKYVVNVFDFENDGQMKEANVTITDNTGTQWFNGTTIDGVIETSYIPTGDEGVGFEGVMTITPTDANYFGTRMVITGGDMTIQNIQDLVNNVSVDYKGYANHVPEIQTNFDKTDTISFYLINQMREDPFHPGTMMEMNPDEISEMEGNSINTETNRYGEENLFFRETIPQEYIDYREHARNIFGFDFVENQVFTERSNVTINDYSIENDDYKDILGWNVSFGNNSTNTVGITPLLFGKIDINSRGEVSYDITDWAGCAREDARKMQLNEVTSRVSYMNSSTPPAFPDTLNQGDRVYTNLFLHYRPTQVIVNPSIRNITNLGYLFVPVKNVGKLP